MNIQANSSTPGLGVTQSGSGNVISAYDGTSEVFTVADGGNVTLGYAGASLYFQNGFNDSNSRIQNGGGSNNSNLKFYTRSSGTEAERLRITSDGDVLLSGLTTKNDGRNAKGITLKSPSGISFQNYGSNGSRNWRIRPDDLTAWGSLEFSVSPTDNNNTDWPDAAGDVVLELKKDKNVVVKNGNLVIGTSGNGIDFSATGNISGTASELLDDYEEGTFDPTIAPTSGSITLQSSFNTLSYLKIGRLVYIGGQIRISSVSSPSGNTTISNLPFTVQSTTEQGRAGANCFYYDASAGTGNYYKAVPIHALEGTTTLKILNLHALGGFNPAANDELAFAFSYMAAS